MRVVYDRTALELDHGGTGRAIREMETAIARRPDIALLPVAHPPGRRGLVRGLERELVWEPFGLPRRARALGADVLHCPAPLGPVRPRMPMVVTIHDAATLDHPEWFTKANVWHHRLVVGHVVRAAARVICPTRHAADTVARGYGVDPARIDLVPLGVDPQFRPGDRPEEPLGRLGVTGPYILAVGTLQPRKNIEGLLVAFERLRAEGAPHHLIVAGATGWGAEAIQERLAGSAAASQVVLPGRVSDAELVGLYRGADVFVFPSRYEGFGLPVLEAMACGTPVVANARTSLPEVVGDAGIVTDADDPGALLDAVREALEPGRAAELRERGVRRAAQFTWERTAEGTVASYRAAAAV